MELLSPSEYLFLMFMIRSSETAIARRTYTYTKMNNPIIYRGSRYRLRRFGLELQAK